MTTQSDKFHVYSRKIGVTLKSGCESDQRVKFLLGRA